MNLPNKLTIFRVVLVPFFISFLFWNSLPLHYLWAMIIFVIASITDALDGYIARKYNLVTTFGKFLDPIADKVLVVAALISFVELNLCSSVAVIIIIAREFIVTSIRLAAVDNGNVIAAGILGKVKTAFTMVAIIAILLLQIFTGLGFIELNITTIIGQILIWIATLLTVVSGAEYVIRNKNFINTTK